MKPYITHAIDGEYIREWLILGPFFPDDLDRDFLADAGGEANINPREGDTVTTEAGERLAWRRYESREDIVDLVAAVGGYEHATAYAFCVLQSEFASDADIHLGSDDGVAVWMNGERVHTFPLNRALSLDQDIFEVNLKAGANYCLVKIYNISGLWAFALRAVLLPPGRAVISGVIGNEEGVPITNAHVSLEQNGEEIAQTRTDNLGNYRLFVYPAHGIYDLSATGRNLGDWQPGIQLHAAERRELNLTLKEAIGIEGTLLMLDNRTPHVAMLVQAVIPASDDKGEPIIADTVLSDESGRYQFINLRPGQYEVRCCIPDEYLYYGQRELAMGGVALEIEQGKTLRNMDFRFPPVKKGNWRHYTRLDGLAHNTVNTIYVDSDGFMWLGTDGGGVSRFDGKEFTNLATEDGLPTTPAIWSIHQDKGGVMWFGVRDHGVYRYDGSKFVHFGAEVDGLASAFILCIKSDSSGAIWFGTVNSGLFRYDEKGFTRFTMKDGLASNIVIMIHEAPDGTLWFMTANGASSYDGKEFTSMAHKDALLEHFHAFSNLTSDHTVPVHRGLNGSVWYFGMAEAAVVYPAGSRRDGKRFIHFTTSDIWPHKHLATHRFTSIQSTSDGALWFGMWGGGLSRYDGKRFVNFATQDGSLSNAVKQLYADPDGVIWVASGSSIERYERGGLSRYDPKGFVNFTTQDGLPGNSISALHCSRDGTLWIGVMGNGISRYDGKEFKNFTTEDGLADNHVSIIQEDGNGILWFGTGLLSTHGSGVSRYNTRTGEFLKPLTIQNGLASNTVRSICIAPDGIAWLGTTAGISRYDSRTGRFLETLTTQDGLADNSVLGILCDPDGVMWFITDANITCYNGNHFVNFGVGEGRMRMMKAFHRDPGKVVWSGSLTDVYRYDGKELIRLTQRDGLADSMVRAIYPGLSGFAVVESDEAIWFGTDSNGVSFHDGAAWSSLDTRDGLAGNTVNAIVQDDHGSLWFGTQDGGLTRYRRSSSRPRTYITSLTTDETYSDLSAIPALTIGTRVTIEYNSIDFKTIPEKRQYRCRIKEIDVDWRKAGKSDSFDYVFDELGTYTFEMQAIDRDLNYSEPAWVKLEIVPDPRDYRIAQLESEMEERERAQREAERIQAAKMVSLRQLVAGVAHQMNNPVGTIASNNDISRRVIGKIREIIVQLGSQEIKENKQLARSFAILEKMDSVNQDASGGITKIVTDLRSFVRLDEAEWQLADIHEAMDHVLGLVMAEFPNRIRVVKNYENIPRIYCSPSNLNQVFMSMFRNACEFIEGDGEVRLSTSAQNENIIIEISDTGKGIPAADMDRIFDPGFTTKGVRVGVGLGLSICYQIIVDEHKGRIDVSSNPGKGTTFTITLPQHHA